MRTMRSMMVVGMLSLVSFFNAFGATYYVKEGGAGTQSGLSWANAAAALQAAIEACEGAGGGEVWVAAGTFKPAGYPNGGSSARQHHFSLRNGVRIMGGFPASGSPGIGLRNPVLNVTICSGDIGVPGNTDNCYHVFYHPGSVALDASAVLDGVHVTGGNASEPYFPTQYGGGMLNVGCSPTLIRCVLEDNYGYCGGGLMNAEGSSPHVVTCVFDANIGHFGGGLRNDEESHPRFENCVFARNRADYEGGAVHNFSGCTPRFVNCTFVGNHAEHDGGVLHNASVDEPRFVNCIFWNNTCSHGWVFSWVTSIQYPSINYSTVQGGWRGGSNIRTGDPLFVDVLHPKGADALWFTADDGLAIQAASDSRDHGSNEALPSDSADADGDGNRSEPLPLDLLGRTRVTGVTVDFGVYEHGAPAPLVHDVDFVLSAKGIRIGGGALHQEVQEGRDAEAPIVAGQGGWSFIGWDADFTSVVSNMTVNALYSLSTHDVTFNLGSHGWRVGGGVLAQNVPHGTGAAAPRVAVADGWYFLGWDTAFDSVTSDLIVNAQYRSVSFAGSICYVKVGATGQGSSWADAMGDLQAAIEAVHAYGTGQVWVARGTYKPTSWPNGGDLERELHFSLRNNVTVYGGFPSFGSPILKERDPVGNLTELSGDIGVAMDAGDNVYHVFYHSPDAALDASAVLNGFYVSWGNANGSVSPHNKGGGMYNEGCGPTISRCPFGENRARYGGGIYCKYDPAPAVLRCRFSDNVASQRGGGVRNYGASPTFEDCEFHSNDADYGGGMANELSSAQLTLCSFDSNTASDWGGGMYNAGASPSLVSVLFEGNTADEGAGMFNHVDAAPSVANGVFLDNTANFFGGAVYNEGDAAPVLAQCVVYGNSAGQGGGFYNRNAAPALTNSIVWGNSGGNFFNLTSISTVHHCILEGGFAGGTYVLDLNPLFEDATDPNGADNEWFTDDDGFRLTTASPGVNAGDDAGVPADVNDLDGDGNTSEALPRDLRDDARTVGGHVDMGAYEHELPPTHTVTFKIGSHGTHVGGGDLTQIVEQHGVAEEPALRFEVGWTLTGWDTPFDDVTNGITVNAVYGPAFSAGDICYVREGGLDNGESWERATGDLQGAIDIISSVGSGQVWVAAGTFKPNSHPNGGTGDRQQHFSLRNGVSVYGGFPATGSPGIYDRDPWGQLTVCSGDIGVEGSPNDNVNQVFYHPVAAALTGSAVLDGVTIRDGYTEQGEGRSSGAGMYNLGCSPTLANCVFCSGNAYRGGAMYNNDSSPSLTYCVFNGNTATNGGGMRNYSASPSLVNCVFANNTAVEDGGGMNNDTSAEPSLANCLFSGNSAGDDGGGVWNSSSSPMLHGCVFSDNTAASTGGGIYSYVSSFPCITNSILWGNTASSASNMYDSGSSDAAVHHCIVGGGWAGGTAVIDSDPLFVNAADPDGGDDRWFYGEEGLAPQPGSPGVNTGDASVRPPDVNDLDGDGNTAESLPLDLRGNERVIAGELDIGAYEIVPRDAGPSPVHYVSLDGAAVWPYTNWTDAATTIQDAVDAADGGDTVLVADGTYDRGGAVTPGYGLLNRVCVTNNITLRSANGAEHTVIVGSADPGGDAHGNGSNAVRCVYLNGDIAMSGFTLTNGHTWSVSEPYGNYRYNETGGGVWLENATVSNCVAVGNFSDHSGGGAYCNHAGLLALCTVSNNYAHGRGGGVYLSYGGVVSDSIIVENSTTSGGGGVECYEGGAVIRCRLTGNSAGWGGGVYAYNDGILDQCVLSDNRANHDGGGAFLFNNALVMNCLMTGNHANEQGGGAYCAEGGTLNGCTISGNTTDGDGGGIYCENGGAMATCIAHGNTAVVDGDNLAYAVPGAPPTIVYTCSPDVIDGVDGNITSDPAFVDAFGGDHHLSGDSPCVDTGRPGMSVVRDLEGRDRPLDGDGDGTLRSDMGCYEYVYAPPHTMHASQLPDPNGWDVCATTPDRLIDDFDLTSKGPLTHFTFWGSWQSNIVGTVTGVVLTLRADDTFWPGAVLWTATRSDFLVREMVPSLQGWLAPAAKYAREDDHTRYFRYDVFIPEDQGYTTSMPGRRWLDLQVLTEGGTWGWKTTTNVVYGSAALWQDSPVGTWSEVLDPSMQSGMDLAFVVNALDDPEMEDFGDAPDPRYQTLAVNNGARHTILEGMYLGEGVDGEPDGQQSADALGDDRDSGAGNPFPNYDDDDGVTFLDPLVAGGTSTVRVVVGPMSGGLDAWIDFQADGSWMDPGDEIARGLWITSGVNVVSFPVPEVIEPGPTYARFRFSGGGWMDPFGPAPAGEVEDYLVVVRQRRPAVAPRITDIRVLYAGQKQRVTWTAQSNVVYQLQTTPSLIPTGVWQSVGDRVRGPANRYTDSHAPATTRYYRVTAPYVSP